MRLMITTRRQATRVRASRRALNSFRKLIHLQAILPWKSEEGRYEGSEVDVLPSDDFRSGNRQSKMITTK
jgi:hypothetical protein